jgi:hypothetical protein
LFREKSTAGWWLISRANRLLVGSLTCGEPACGILVSSDYLGSFEEGQPTKHAIEIITLTFPSLRHLRIGFKPWCFSVSPVDETVFCRLQKSVLYASVKKMKRKHVIGRQLEFNCSGLKDGRICCGAAAHMAAVCSCAPSCGAVQQL